MADCVKTILNSNPIRHGSRVVLANDFGTIGKLDGPLPDGALGTETILTNRLSNSLTPYSTYVTITASGTETSWSIPEGTDKFLFKSRTQDNITFGFNSGDASGVNKMTLFSGAAYESPENISTIANQNVYFTGPSGQIVEIHYWK